MFCDNCGLDNLEEARYCMVCGSDLSNADPAPLKEGATFAGRYLILSGSSAGSLGATCKAEDQVRGMTVALKLIHPRFLSSPESIETFEREMAVAKALDHPNIARTYGQGDRDGQYFYAMEWVDGSPLRDALERRRKESRQFSLQESLDVILPVMKALSYAHSYTVHLDIRPENIMLSPGRDSMVKVTDFAVARMLSASHRRAISMRSGTQSYIAPELIYGVPGADRRADIYSLGVVFYEMLTGRVPEGRFLSPPSEVNGSYPRALDLIIDRAVSTDPADRYPDMDAMLADITGLVSSSPSPVATEGPVEDRTTEASPGPGPEPGPAPVVAESKEVAGTTGKDPAGNGNGPGPKAAPPTGDTKRPADNPGKKPAKSGFPPLLAAGLTVLAIVGAIWALPAIYDRLSGPGVPASQMAPRHASSGPRAVDLGAGLPAAQDTEAMDDRAPEGGPAVDGEAGQNPETPGPAASGPAAHDEEAGELVVVDQHAGGIYRSLGEAIDAAEEGSTIRVSAGTYNESIRITKPGITLEGEPGAKIISSNGDALYFNAATGTVRNIKMRYVGREGYHGVNVEGGSLLIEGCEVSGNSRSAIIISNGSGSVIRGNSISDNAWNAVEVGAGSKEVVIQDNEIRNNGYPVEISFGAQAVLRDNKITGGKRAGIRVSGGGKADILDNDISGNRAAGIEALRGASVIVRGNNVRSNQRGISVKKGAKATVIANNFRGNRDGAYDIEDYKTVELKKNIE